MLANPKSDASPQQGGENDKEKDAIPPKVAWVARNRSGADGHNTLTPRWELDFSV